MCCTMYYVYLYTKPSLVIFVKPMSFRYLFFGLIRLAVFVSHKYHAHGAFVVCGENIQRSYLARLRLVFCESYMNARE